MCRLSGLVRCFRTDTSARHSSGSDRRHEHHTDTGHTTLRHHLTPLPNTDIPMKEARMSSISSHGPSSGTEMETRLRNNRSSVGGHDPATPPSPAASSDKTSKACCFCWCCCCSCSWCYLTPDF